MVVSAIAPWPPGRATERIRALVADDTFGITPTKHAKERMAERDLIIGDVLHVLRYGYVHEEAESSTQDGYYKYTMESTTPNSNGRTVKVVVIPSLPGHTCEVKLITVMWADEPSAVR